MLTKHQEVRIQGYIPMSNRSKSYGSALMASSIPSSILNNAALSYASGHRLFDTQGIFQDEYGLGAEAEVGQYLPFHQGGWIRAGLYHFNYSDSKYVTGVEANIELFTGKVVSIILQNNYDNQNKNKIAVGLRVNLGGPDHTQVNTLTNRMEEPIIRHLARQSYGMATPIKDNFIPLGPTQVVASNLWFFNRNGTN